MRFETAKNDNLIFNQRLVVGLEYFTKASTPQQDGRGSPITALSRISFRYCLSDILLSQREVLTFVTFTVCSKASNALSHVLYFSKAFLKCMHANVTPVSVS